MLNAASAASYDLGTIPVPSSYDIAGQVTGDAGSTHIVDEYQFKVGDLAELGVNAFNLTSSHIVDFDVLEAALLDSACGFCVIAGASGASGVALSYANLLTSSTYILRISGTLGALAKKGIYKGELSVSAVPVPPALILFGTAIAGVAAFSRRRARVTAAA